MEIKAMKEVVVWYSISLITLSTLCVSDAYAENPEDILIVANPECPRSSISLGEARAFFLKQRTSWSMGERIYVFNAKHNTKLKLAFRERVLKMDSAEEDAYWIDSKLMKGIAPPPEFDNVLKAVFKIKNSIGYIFRKNYKEGVVKILLVVKKPQ